VVILLNRGINTASSVVREVVHKSENGGKVTPFTAGPALSQGDPELRNKMHDFSFL
jgi:hypothetical protein